MRRQAFLVAVLAISAGCAGSNMEMCGQQTAKSYSPPLAYSDTETVKFFRDNGFQDENGIVAEDGMNGRSASRLIWGVGTSLSWDFQDARVGDPEKLRTLLKSAVRRIITELGDEARQPVWELSGSRRMVVDRALVIAGMISDTDDVVISCASKAKLGLVEKMFSSTLAGLVDNDFFWEGWQDFAWPGTMPDSKRRFGIYAGRPETQFAYRGLFGGMDKSCGETTAEAKLSPAKTVSLKVLSSDWRNVLVLAPTIDLPGLFPVEITFGARRGPRCTKVAVSTFLPVTKDTEYSLSYNVTTLCRYQVEKLVYHGIYLFRAGGELHQTFTLEAPAGTTVTKCGHEATSINGCFMAVKQVKNTCVANLDCVEANGSYIGNLYLESSGYDYKAGKSVRGEFKTPINAGNEVGEIVMPKQDPACIASVNAVLRGTNGKEIRFATLRGRGLLFSFYGKVELWWNFELWWNSYDGSLMVKTPSESCEYFY